GCAQGRRHRRDRGVARERLGYGQAGRAGLRSHGGAERTLMEAQYTRGLSEFIADLKFDAIPRDVVETMKLLVLDTIGAGLLGAGMPWSIRMRQTVQEMEGPGDASIWGTRLAFSAPTAALVNGTAVHGFEIDDVGAGGHNGSVTLTSVSPLGQHRGSILGKDIITATTA